MENDNNTKNKLNSIHKFHASNTITNLFNSTKKGFSKENTFKKPGETNFKAGVFFFFYKACLWNVFFNKQSNEQWTQMQIQ